MASGGRYAGINPNAAVVAVKVLDAAGRGTSGDALAGIQWIVDNAARYNIRVANLSIGTVDVGSDDPLVKAVEAAWDAGIVVVVAAGNNGPKQSSITSPGTIVEIDMLHFVKPLKMRKYAYLRAYTEVCQKAQQEK